MRKAFCPYFTPVIISSLTFSRYFSLFYPSSSLPHFIPLIPLISLSISPSLPPSFLVLSSLSFLSLFLPHSLLLFSFSLSFLFSLSLVSLSISSPSPSPSLFSLHPLLSSSYFHFLSFTSSPSHPLSFYTHASFSLHFFRIPLSFRFPFLISSCLRVSRGSTI